MVTAGHCEPILMTAVSSPASAPPSPPRVLETTAKPGKRQKCWGHSSHLRPRTPSSVSQAHARHEKLIHNSAEWLSLDQNVAILLSYLV